MGRHIDARMGAALGVACVLGMGTACNLITGADGLRVSDDDEEGSGTESNGAGAGMSGPTGAGGGGGSLPTDGFLPTDAASITSLDLYQAIRRPLMSGGQPASSTVPVVAGREAMLRIFYNATAQATVTVRVTIGDQEPIVVQANVSGSSQAPNLASTINVDIPAERMNGSGYRVELLQPPEQTSGMNGAAVFPASGLQNLPIQSSGPSLKLVLVPIAYGADGSNRVPSTAEAQLQVYRDVFYQMYPTPTVDIRVAAQMQWNSSVSAGGSGWDSLLDGLSDYRQQSGAASDEYYYGIFMPTGSFQSYCTGGCVTGLSWLADSPGDSWARAGIGVGYSGSSSADTAAHEVGHQHGRNHAPCQVSDGDPGFPHAGGRIGDWGYDLLGAQLIDADTADFMGYCSPTWVSDYTFTALFNRLAAVNGANSISYPAHLLDRTYERVRIGVDGEAIWLEPVTLHTPPMGEQTTVTVSTDGGEMQLTGQFYPYSHLPGGTLLFPQSAAGYRASFARAGVTAIAER